MLLFAGVVGAAELRNVAVDHVDGRYKLTSEVWFDTDIESIFAVFLDYDLAAQFTSFIVEARNLEPDENGRRRFYIRNQGCAWFFCSTFERSGHVEHEARQFIRSTADPEVSDFEFEPKFWIPPLIGPYVLQLKLQRDSAGAIHRIEAIAQGLQQ